MTTTLETAPVMVTCPADGHVVGTVPSPTAGEISALAEALSVAQPGRPALGGMVNADHAARAGYEASIAGRGGNVRPARPTHP